MLEAILIICEQFFLYVPLILGAYLSFSLMKIPNFGLEAAFVTGAIFASKVLAITHLLNPAISLLFVCLASLLGGLCAGVMVAMLVTKGNIPHLLANVLGIGIFYGINLYLLGGSNISVAHFASPLILLPLHAHPELGVLLFLGIMLIFLCFLLCKTQLGYCFAVYGNNPLFFEHYGISTTFVVGCGLAIANALAGLSGFLVAQSTGFVDINAGTGLSLFCITALILGKIIKTGKTTLAITVPVIGLMIYCLLQQLLLKIGFNLKYFTLMQSFIVLLVLIVKYRKQTVHDLSGDHLGV